MNPSAARPPLANSGCAVLRERLAGAERRALAEVLRGLPEYPLAEVQGDWPALLDAQGALHLAPRGGAVGAVPAHAAALPLRTASLGALVLTHVLDEHASFAPVLAEAERVLAPGGQLLVVGMNPWSLCGLREWAAGRGGRARLSPYLRAPGTLRVALLRAGLVTEAVRTVFYQSPLARGRPGDAGAIMDRLGPHLLPRAGGAYVLTARKQQVGVRPLRAPLPRRLPARVRPVGMAVRTPLS